MSASLALRQTAQRVAMARRFGPGVVRRAVPAPRPPTLVESDYAHRLVGVVDQLREVVRHELSTWAWMHRADDHQEHQGAEGRRRMKRVRAVVDHDIAEKQLEVVAADFGGRVAAQQRGELARQAEAALGTDVVVTDGAVPDLIAGFVHENVSLIKRLQGDVLGHVEAIITRAAAAGERAESMQRQIEDRFGIAERHARLISHDQVQKLTSRVTQARNAELGIGSYIWIHVPNLHPRPHHEARHGKVFRYDAPPADGHAGWAIMCHCLQQANFDDIYAELDRLGV